MQNAESFCMLLLMGRLYCTRCTPLPYGYAGRLLAWLRLTVTASCQSSFGGNVESHRVRCPALNLIPKMGMVRKRVAIKRNQVPSRRWKSFSALRVRAPGRTKRTPIHAERLCRGRDREVRSGATELDLIGAPRRRSLGRCPANSPTSQHSPRHPLHANR
eukprot:7123129-Prymnesium_polylepis.2